ncbi:MAG: hypothetical protein ACFFFH_02865 [Candidatus Thorarchaeota archaeon]
MNITDENVKEYLDQVKRRLKSLDDKDQILQELRTHIWDVAQDIATEENVSISQAIEIALTRMEDPETLANRFLAEYEEFEGKYPETRITEEQFLIIGVLGLVFVAIVSAVFTAISKESWIFWVFTLIPGIILAVIAVVYLYFKDEKEFQEQMELFREEIRQQLFAGKEKELEPSSSWGALRTHVGGLIGAFAVILTMILMFWITVTEALPLFNENWYISGALACYITWTSNLFAYLAQFFLGRIRVSRLITAADNAIGSLALITLFLAYPFTVGQTLIVLGFTFLSGVDSVLWIILAIATVVMVVSAMYNFVKFGIWQPEEKKSLL